MEATVPRHKYPICDPLGSPTIHLSVSLYREGWNTFDLCEKCHCLSNIINTEGPAKSVATSTYGVKNIQKSSVHLTCASLFCLWVELVLVQIYNDATCNIFVS